MQPMAHLILDAPGLWIWKEGERKGKGGVFDGMGPCSY